MWSRTLVISDYFHYIAQINLNNEGGFISVFTRLLVQLSLQPYTVQSFANLCRGKCGVWVGLFNFFHCQLHGVFITFNSPLDNARTANKMAIRWLVTHVNVSFFTVEILAKQLSRAGAQQVRWNFEVRFKSRFLLPKPDLVFDQAF